METDTCLIVWVREQCMLGKLNMVWPALTMKTFIIIIIIGKKISVARRGVRPRLYQLGKRQGPRSRSGDLASRVGRCESSLLALDRH